MGAFRLDSWLAEDIESAFTVGPCVVSRVSALASVTYPFCRFAHRQPQGCLQEVPRFGWSIAHLVTKNMFGVCAWLLRFEAMVAAHSTGYVYYVSAPRKGKRNYSQRNLWVKLGVFSGTC